MKPILFILVIVLVYWWMTGFLRHRRLKTYKSLRHVYDDGSYHTRDRDTMRVGRHGKDVPRVSADQFARGRPCIVTGLSDEWACKEWTFDYFKRHYGDVYFESLVHNENTAIGIKFSDFHHYAKHQRDNFPLYIFDENLDMRDDTKHLIDQWTVPDIFRDDWFDRFDNEVRPPYRWIILSPKRSGQQMHVDPLGTSAWNTLLSGKKRWIVFKPDADVEGDIRESGIDWYLHHYDDCKHLEHWDFMQHPGETVYIPSGYWHNVINLEDCVSVTQNFLPNSEFPKHEKMLRRERPDLFVKEG